MSVKTYLIEYCNHRKKVNMISELHVRNLFKIDDSVDIFLQYYDEEFKCYVDCNWDEISQMSCRKFLVCEEIPKPTTESENSTWDRNRPKCLADIKLETASDPLLLEWQDPLDTSGVIPVLRHKSFDDQLKLSEQSAVPPIACSNAPQTSHITDSPETISRNLFLQPNFSTYSVRAVSEINEEKDCLQASCLNQNFKYDIPPTSYKLPKVSADSKLGRALNNKRPLNKALKTLFLSMIYDSFTKRNMFYIGQQYSEIANAILNEYPYLGKGLPYESAKKLWVQSLYAKFSNSRARDYATEETVITKKARRSDPSSKNTSVADFSSWWFIPNYKPITSDDEDHFSVESHMSWMIAEFEKVNRDETCISMYMDLTFKKRRNALFSQLDGKQANALSSDILRQYPCLRIESQAIKEVERLMGTRYHRYKYEKYITNFSLLVSETVSASRSKYKGFLDELFGTTSSLMNDAIKLYQLVGNIAILVSENPGEIVSKENNTPQAPLLYVTAEGGVTLTVDGQPFIANISALNAPYLWVATFYLFNVKVPRKIKRTFNILQHLIFNIPETPKICNSQSKVLDIWNKL